MNRGAEPAEPIKPGKRPVHDRDDSRQEREKDYVKQVHDETHARPQRPRDEGRHRPPH